MVLGFLYGGYSANFESGDLFSSCLSVIQGQGILYIVTLPEKLLMNGATELVPLMSSPQWCIETDSVHRSKVANASSNPVSLPQRN